MDFSHFNEEGHAKMVDVSLKDKTLRTAIAKCDVYVNKETLHQIKTGGIKKGDVLSVAQVAGIMACKNTSNIIPMAHPLPISSIDIHFSLYDEGKIEVISEVKVNERTGVEMEALTACSVCALTIYDMCKALQKDIRIDNLHLVKKTGGKSNYEV